MIKKFVFLPILLFSFLAIGFWLGNSLVIPVQTGDSSSLKSALFKSSDEGRKLEQIIRYIDNEYVDSVARKELVDESIQHILQELDPHSYYISAEELQAMNEPLEGNFEGIGVQFNIRKDTVVVITPLVGGPSEKVGIKAGDRIVAVEEENIAGIGIRNSDVLKLLKGEKGTKVKVTVQRHSEELSFTIVRDKIPIHSVEVGYMLNDSVGYIKLSRFAKTTYDEFVETSDKLLARGMEKLVVDVRGNGGGFLDAAVNIADEFLKEDELIVYTEGRSRPREEFRATSRKDLLENTEVSILIDESSASASEILAGAIQDNDRGTVIGRRSFGKGLVQEQTIWPDGSATRLTIARYYTPTGRSIQKPYSDGSESYHEEMYDRYSHGEMFSEDSLTVNDSLKYLTKGGKTVYGGGGIYPDVFVPYDTTRRSAYLTALVYNGLIYEWAWNYADDNREVLLQYADAVAFSKEFNMDDTNLYEDFSNYAEELGISKSLTGYSEAKTKKEIKKRIKAYIARNIWGNEGFYPIWNEGDSMLKTSYSNQN